MKIGFVIEYFKPHAIGGGEQSADLLARALVERGHEVTVLTPNYGAARDEIDHGVHIHRYWFPRRMESGKTARSFWIKNPLYYPVAAAAIARTVRRHGIEILHAHNTFVQAPTFLAARRAGIPCVATIRDTGSLCSVGYFTSIEYDPDHKCSENFSRCARAFLERYFPSANPVYRFRLRLDQHLKHADLIMRRRVLRRFSRLAFISRGLRDAYIRHGFPGDPKRFAVIYNPAPDPIASRAAANVPPPAEWQLPESGPIIAFIGKLSLGKGVHILLQAIPRVLERHPEAVFVLAGRRTPQVEIPASIPADRLRLLGQIAINRVYTLLARSDLVVMPSICIEGLGRVILEAHTFGVPVIGSRRGGIPELIVENENGWIVEPGDSLGLADCIAAALDRPELLRSMRERCQTLLRERLGTDRIVEQTLSIYREAIAERAGSS